jgi:putative alpha-1,2-mannosidase
MFSYANRSDLVQKYSRFILKTFYSAEANGLPGNDDYSTMSAWLVFASLGFYPLPSTNRYILGSPVISYAKISRKMGNNSNSIFYIHANGNSIDKDYVRRVDLDGK